jgi:hypothetical protein
MQPALEFASWASCTPVQRAAALRSQALVAAELRSSARMAAICEWGSAASKTQLPAAAAAAAVEDLGRAAQPDAGWLAGGQGGGVHEAADRPVLQQDREALVQQMLQANQALLARLQV